MTRDELAAAGFQVAAPAYARLERFIALLLAESRRVNLTAIRDEQQAWVRHICDSLVLLPLIREAQPRHLLDLGSGGGLPGVPLACVCPDVQVTLLDATRKKLAAVGRIVSELGLTNVRSVCGRAETLAHDAAWREQFDVVAARAVGALRVLAEYAAGFMRVGGLAWFLKTSAACDQEVATAEDAARLCALELAGVHRYRLPGAAAERAIVIYRKRAMLRADLPRRVGRARKRPL